MLDLTDGRTRLMGVLNVTPDSFSDGGLFEDVDAAVGHALAMVEAGADVLDIGGESTRPQHEIVPPAQQMDRVLPVIEAVRARVDVPISIDTTKASVASSALDAGADWINDTSALLDDAEMAAVAAERGCPIVLMHRFDPPRSDGAPVTRSAVMGQIVDNLRGQVEAARQRGIDESRILLDPGIGFGTLAEDNLLIHAHIGDLQDLGRPLVVGPSRKSFLGHLTGKPTSGRLAATAACVAILALRGVALVRIHDVDAMRDVVTVANAIRTADD